MAKRAAKKKTVVRSKQAGAKRARKGAAAKEELRATRSPAGDDRPDGDREAEQARQESLPDGELVELLGLGELAAEMEKHDLARVRPTVPAGKRAHREYYRLREEDRAPLTPATERAFNRRIAEAEHDLALETVTQERFQQCMEFIHDAQRVAKWQIIEGEPAPQAAFFLQEIMREVAVLVRELVEAGDVLTARALGSVITTYQAAGEVFGPKVWRGSSKMRQGGKRRRKSGKNRELSEKRRIQELLAEPKAQPEALLETALLKTQERLTPTDKPLLAEAECAHLRGMGANGIKEFLLGSDDPVAREEGSRNSAAKSPDWPWPPRITADDKRERELLAVMTERVHAEVARIRRRRADQEAVETLGEKQAERPSLAKIVSDFIESLRESKQALTPEEEANVRAATPTVWWYWLRVGPQAASTRRKGRVRDLLVRVLENTAAIRANAETPSLNVFAELLYRGWLWGGPNATLEKCSWWGSTPFPRSDTRGWLKLILRELQTKTGRDATKLAVFRDLLVTRKQVRGRTPKRLAQGSMTFAWNQVRTRLRDAWRLMAEQANKWYCEKTT